MGVDLSQERASDLKSSLSGTRVKNTPPSCCDCKSGRRRVDDPRLASFQAKLSNVGQPSSHLVCDVCSDCGSLQGKAHLAEAVAEAPNPAFVTRSPPSSVFGPKPRLQEKTRVGFSQVAAPDQHSLRGWARLAWVTSAARSSEPGTRQGHFI